MCQFHVCIWALVELPAGRDSGAVPVCARTRTAEPRRMQISITRPVAADTPVSRMGSSTTGFCTSHARITNLTRSVRPPFAVVRYRRLPPGNVNGCRTMVRSYGQIRSCISLLHCGYVKGISNLTFQAPCPEATSRLSSARYWKSRRLKLTHRSRPRSSTLNFPPRIVSSCGAGKHFGILNSVPPSNCDLLIVGEIAMKPEQRRAMSRRSGM